MAKGLKANGCRSLQKWLGDAVLEGKRAMGKYRSRVIGRDEGGVRCSVDLDGAVRRRFPNANRWDYLLVLQGDSTLAVEVHPATPGEVKRIVAKKEWAKALVERECKELRAGAIRWVWIATSTIYLRPTDPESRRLAQAGIEGPASRLRA